MEYNSWTVLFLIASVQGLLLGLMILWKRRDPSHSLLAYIILIYSVILTHYVAYWTGLMVHLPVYIWILGGLTFVIAPLYYFFLKKRPHNESIGWHSVPFLLYLITFFLQLIFRINLGKYIQIAQVIHLIFYASLCYKLMKQNDQQDGWLASVALSFYIYVAGFTTYYFLFWFEILTPQQDYIISLIMTGFIYYIGYKGFMMTELVMQTRRNESPFSSAFIESLTNKMETWLDSQNAYLESEYKIADLSTDMATPVHVLSHVINSNYGVSFNEWINAHRIEHAKALIKQAPDQTLISIAYQSGFNNKVSFIKNFKKHVGMTPTSFKESLLEITN